MLSWDGAVGTIATAWCCFSVSAATHKSIRNISLGGVLLLGDRLSARCEAGDV